ncbi:MAG: hypothetical protein B7Y41_05855 [Hydrogenophilales bacterium 28-61-23]|nr:MAG: hypothetical protein B7Y41_05855 [Hydrogenophilales bacterium 28-61-23]
MEDLTPIANIATAVGVAVTAWQLRQSKQQSITTFEDAFAREYRELAAKLPTKALLGKPLTHKEYCDAFDEFYHYVDLCNTQVFHHQEGRISDKTWKYWRDGMETNLSRPAFERAWSEIAAANGDFLELKKEFPPAPMNSKEECKK